jgi:hypothetical protein
MLTDEAILPEEVGGELEPVGVEPETVLVSL